MDSLFTTELLSSYLLPFFTLSYSTTAPKNPDSFPNAAYYTTGSMDLCVIITCIAVMAILRDVVRIGLLEPFARWKLSRDLIRQKNRQIANGTAALNLKGQANPPVNGGYGPAYPTSRELRQLHRSVLRFAEQGWSFMYYAFQWFYGLYIHLNLPTRILDPTDLWRDYPHIPIAGPVKFYYLMQTAFYIHQMLILNAEARRKDHVQMMTHHIITVFLISSSYFSNFTRVGCLILVTMDWCDIWLSLAKMLRYIAISQLATDITFGWFLFSWLITRHVLFTLTMISTLRDCPRMIPFKWSPEEGRYLSRNLFYAFSSMLIAIQVLQVIWLVMICRVAWRVITTDKGASDDRSDESDNERKED